ncbi:MAG: UDP-N-acetylmuramoylalanine-D-glutamate ligase [Berkelbacteria bacterium GW2011_GWA2_38_9]|uniref:UDP-N-acetylmuramoylalanine--D-glutamate ligase n=1 Tax=Berkelbacteria bacterium GW2011_GWA2_38_9 TaxID=1618334 RepID=A0A0G0PGD4_9BACT|nr:MAG: UDP-N-acetylmuramoylalanine-D-glutamate ligase [Berkelbacteria bacterium GW2011_GWA2_38_9]
MKFEDLKSKKIGVLGFGTNNQKLVFWLLKHDIASVAICDKDPEIHQKLESRLNDDEKSILTKILDWRVGDNFLENLSDFDIVFRTPGLPLFSPEIQVAKSAGVIISSQTELFLELVPCQTIGVTGTKGKSTTAAMIAHLLNKSKVKNQKSKIQVKSQKFNKIYLAGNIGRDPFEFIDELKAEDIVVLELSSFQLQGIGTSPHVAVVTRLGSDHLNYHQNLQEYYDAKSSIVSHQKSDDYLIINIDSTTAVLQIVERSSGQIISYSGRTPISHGVYVEVGANEVGQVMINDVQLDTSLIAGSADEAKVVGRHNMENWAAAAAVGYFVYGIKAGESREFLKSFNGLPYRTEFIREVGGVRFYNDSYSTNPDSTIAALESFESPVILICGGSSKNIDFSDLAKKIRERQVKAVLAMGQEGPRILETLSGFKDIGQLPKLTAIVEDLETAIKKANDLSEPNDVVLLSPACASFDMFENATDRGERFNTIVNNLIAN